MKLSKLYDSQAPTIKVVIQQFNSYKLLTPPGLRVWISREILLNFSKNKLFCCYVSFDKAGQEPGSHSYSCHPHHSWHQPATPWTICVFVQTKVFTIQKSFKGIKELIPQIIVQYRYKIFQTNHGNYGRLSTLQTGSVSQEASSSEKQSHQERADGHRSGAVGHLHRIHRAADKVMESTKCETFDNLFICSEWYEKFKSECPNGFMTRKKGVSMYFLCEID